MPIRTLPAACWRLVDPDGKDYPPDPGSSHYDSEEAAVSTSRWYVDDPALTPVPYARPCVMVVCDGCGADPEDDEFGRIHFPDEQTAAGYLDLYDYVRVGDRVWCVDCKTEPHQHVGPAAFCARCGGMDADHDWALPVHR